MIRSTGRRPQERVFAAEMALAALLEERMLNRLGTQLGVHAVQS